MCFKHVNAFLFLNSHVWVCLCMPPTMSATTRQHHWCWCFMWYWWRKLRNDRVWVHPVLFSTSPQQILKKYVKSSLFTLYRIRSYPDEEKPYYIEADLEDLRFVTSKSGAEGLGTRFGARESEPQYPCVWTCTRSGNQLVFTWHSNHVTCAFLFSIVSSRTLVNMFDLKVVTNLIMSNLFQYFKGCLNTGTSDCILRMSCTVGRHVWI